MRTTLQTKVLVALIVSSVLVVATIFALSIQKQKALGNVSPDDVLLSTSTPQVANGTNLCPPLDGRTAQQGTLGSVHILKPGAGSFGYFDATTTDITKRDASQSTTSIALAWFPAGTGTSTYAFNLEFKRGLIVQSETGIATTTITFRCGS